MAIRKSKLPVGDPITQMREANQNLVIASLRAQDLQDQAEAVIQRQKEFLAMLAHELRNPLAPIAMAAGMLEKVSAAHPKLPYIQQVIARQVTHITRLLEDLLDASRVTSGKINLRNTQLHLHDIVRSAVEISQPSLDKKRQPLTLDLPDSPVVIEGDAVRLAQVFSNLLINASKYSAQGQPIGVSARLQGGAMVAVCVRDEGEGISPEVQPIVFNLFAQAPRTLDRSEGGLGIGLSLVRALVEMHGGTVGLHSEGLGRGSEFTVLLPVSSEAVAPEALQARPATLARARQILIVEDNVDANEALRFCLSDDGHAVASAFDGLAGLAMASEGGYDIIICDIGLPGLDGYELVRQMRLLPVVPQPAYIAMTGYDQQDQSPGAGQAGFDYYLVKPVPMAALQAIIAAIVHPPALR
jgi:two-component system, sensor histidine kinase